MARGQSLYDWCMENGEYGQQLLFEFGDGNNSQQFTDEETGMIKGPHDFSRAGGKKIPWTCKEGHKWIAGLNDRTCRKSKCPECAKLNHGEICRKSRLNKTITLFEWCNKNTFGRILLDEWVGLDEDGININLTDVSYGSNKKVKWKCIHGHEWYATIKSRTGAKTECPYCSHSNLVVDGINDLYTWCINNGDYGELLLEEIDKSVDTHKIAKKTPTKVMWKCSKGHEWEAAVSDRTSRISYCPKCSGHSTSYPEQFIYWAIKQIYPEAINRYKAFKSNINTQGIEYDIAIPIKYKGFDGIYIEYSPTGWHKGKENIDANKREMCQKYNIKFIEIIEDSYREYDEFFGDDTIIFRLVKSKSQDIYEDLLEHILNLIGCSILDINIDEAKRKATEFTLGKIEFEKSLASLDLNILYEWDETNNLSPSEVTIGSNKYVNWTCVYCGNRWCAQIYNRVHNHSGCPNCGYNWYKAQIGQPQKLKKSYKTFKNDASTPGMQIKPEDF